MRIFSPTWFPRGLMLTLATIGIVAPASAQNDPRSEFPLVAKVVPTGEELSSQPRLWIMEVRFKPMRMIEVTLTNPETGQKQRENVWYLVYKAINRPLEQRADAANVVPLNDDDREPIESMFIPELTLVTDDLTDGQPVQEVFHDVILPEAQAAINRREGRTFLNTVEIMQPVPAPTPEDQGDANAIYGVAIWRGVPRETDYFTIFFSGFSNGYRYVQDPVSFDKLREMARAGELQSSDAVWDGLKDVRTASQICNWAKSLEVRTDQHRVWQSAGGVGGLFDDVKAPPLEATDRLWMFTKTADRFPIGKRPPVWRRTIVQHFSRFGDQFNEMESEFRTCREPQWIYRSDEIQNPAPVMPPAAPPTEPVPAEPAPTEPAVNN